MKYDKNTNEIIDKINQLNPTKQYEKIMNRYSTGGPIERSYKKRIGDKLHLNQDKKKDFYEILEKIYKNIYKDQK